MYYNVLHTNPYKQKKNTKQEKKTEYNQFSLDITYK